MSRFSQLLAGVFFSLIVIFCFQSSAALQFNSSDSSIEVTVQFDHHVYYHEARKPLREQALQQIDFQVSHLFGTMAAARFPGVPKGDQKITKIHINGSSGDYSISYHYSGTMLISKGAGQYYEFILPKDPTKIYAASAVRVHGELTYPCTDEHYQTEGDFWYFWNPYNEGCRLKKGRDFEIIKVRLPRTEASSKVTYPEYSRLVLHGGSNNENLIKISVLFGMDEQSNNKNPNKSNDENANNFRLLKKSLVKLGYSAHVLSRREIYDLVPTGTHPLPYIEVLEKKNKLATIRIQLSFTPSGIEDHASRGFHYLFKDALENSSVMIYDGHSGLGGNLDLENIAEVDDLHIYPPKNQYQIYFFDSCSSYSYYNAKFFALKSTRQDKRGTKNLDILANGLATEIQSFPNSSMTIIKAIESWSLGKPPVSYATLAKNIEHNNLFTILGDEDNGDYE